MGSNPRDGADGEVISHRLKSCQVPCGYQLLLWLVVETIRPAIMGKREGSRKVFLGKIMIKSMQGIYAITVCF
jgi:hypothetical protein